MKEEIILMIVLLLIFVPNTLFRRYLATSGKELITMAEVMEQKLLKGEEGNEEEAMQLKEAFIARERIWILIVDHDMLDEIEYEIEDCVVNYHLESKNDFLSATNRLKDKVEDLAKREEISWANIL